MRQSFTARPQEISEALDGIEKLTGWAVQSATARRDVIHWVDGAKSFSEAESHVDFYAKSEYHELTRSVAALKQLVGSLAGLEGRKALLYVSDGIPMTAGGLLKVKSLYVHSMDI